MYTCISLYIYIYIRIYVFIYIYIYISWRCRTPDPSPTSLTPGPPTKSFPTKSPRVKLSGRPPIKFYRHENSHP